MKKLVLGLLATFLVAGGLVGFSGAAAQAGPYTGTVKTSTICKAGNVRVGQTNVVRVRVDPAAGNAEPRGKVTIRITRKLGGYRFVDTKNYNGRTIAFRSSRLTKKGKYTVTCKFDRRANSVWRDSNNVDTFFVTRRG
jgi:Tol biopolymer transport system component